MIIVGCEYAGKTTLVQEIVRWWEEIAGVRIGYHDHFTFPQGGAQRHPPPGQADLPEEELEKLRALSPEAKEIFQRTNIEYHLSSGFTGDDDLILVGFHIEEAVYAPLYFGYGYPKIYGDRECYVRAVDYDIMKHRPDTVLVLLKALPETILKRMNGNPHYDNVVQEKDIEHVLERFEEEYYRSLIRRKFTIDTTNKTVEETLLDFVKSMEQGSHFRPIDTNRILQHQVLMKSVNT